MEDKAWLMALVARLYYIEDQNQETIAHKLNFSRASISRLLKEAREHGIVDIRINYPWQRVPELETELCDKFHLQAASVLSCQLDQGDLVVTGLGVLAARYLLEILKPHTSLTIGTGVGVYQTVKAMPMREDLGITVIQMMGVVGTTNPQFDGAELARQMAVRLGGTYHYIQAPLLVENPTIGRALSSSQAIKSVLELARTAQVGLVGVGSLHPESSNLLQAGLIKRELLSELVGLGAAGIMCGKPYGRYGEPIQTNMNDMAISISLEDLKRIPVVVGVAGGKEKIDALLGGLRGGYLKVLVTDSLTAEMLLAA